MKLFDLHCDTALACYRDGKSLADAGNGLHIAIERAGAFERYTQTLAVFSSPRLTNEEGWETFLGAAAMIEEQKKDFPDKFSYILAVEGGNILDGDISRVDKMAELGVRFLTLVWGGYGCIGGAHSDPEGRGLTDFGRQVVSRCFDLGIIPDMSHASDAIFAETAEMAEERGKTMIATHSDSRALCSHKRCLTDEQFRWFVRHGGVVGMNLCRAFIVDGGDDIPVSIDDLIRHIEHYMSLGGEKTVAMGGDLDGTYPLPLISDRPGAREMTGIEDMILIAERLLRLNYSEKTVNDIFYGNAKAFIDRNGIKEVTK
ncbi:MAG: dipeptidase [Clostridiales bacterium]|nr:dipeptidase [Clostridiales bacterium]